ncbi:MAG: chemotaxis protein MotB [Gaiellaceae bacterium]|jgi:chemotaxis protein MotB|nr:chemotaxis protein MotB [Gaiellaceae bacterium]
MDFHNRPGRLERPGMPVPWPAMLDLITSTLMVFMLITTLELAFGNDDLEAALTRTRQEKFLQDFQHEFAPEIGRREIRVERHLNFIQILFSDGVLFRLGDHRLQGTGQRLVARCARVFARAGTSGYEQIQVEGHTDNVPLDRSAYPSNNWELSTARALSVVEFLSREQPSFAAVLSANGYSSNRPVADNLTQAGRDLNRRIEIRLFFSGTHAKERRRHERSSR